MKLLLTLLCTVIYLTGLAQEKTPSDTTVYEFTVVQAMPKFKGGMKKFYEAVNANLEYPKGAKEAGIKGRVFLSFIVELDGRISNIKVARKLGHGCDEAAVAAVQKTSFTEPAYYKDKPVRMLLNMPVGFGI
jgi:periplasmic protein TonB